MNKYNIEGFRRASESEVREIQLELLQEVLSFCSSHNIQVMLAFGSLIGAIRHEGYIPWDDDIDLWMLREEYERFISEYQSVTGDYKISAVQNNEAHPFPFAKFSKVGTKQFEQIEGKYRNVGVNIDIFPVDYLPDAPKEQEKFLNRHMFWKKLHTLKGINREKKRSWYKSMILALSNAILSLTTSEKLSVKIDEASQKQYQPEAEYVFPYGIPIAMERKLFSEVCYKQFEHLQVPVPVGYDRILTDIYGNYLELPPEDKRVTHHAYQSFIQE